MVPDKADRLMSPSRCHRHPFVLQIELLPPGAGPAGEDVVASLYGSDVVLSNAKNGQVIRVISCGEGEVRRRRLAVSLVCVWF